MAKKPAKKKPAKKAAAKKPAKRKPAKKAPVKKRPAVARITDVKRPGALQILMGIVSYLWILFIIPLFAMRNNEFVHFHAKQGLVWFLSTIALSIFSSLGKVPYLAFIGYISIILALLLVVFWIIAIVNVFLGRKWKMPVLGEWASNLDL